MGTKSDPSKFDCYTNAKPDEPLFILLARDPMAADVVRLWADARMGMIRHGMKPVSDMDMIEEARRCADQMEAWRKENWK